MDRISSEDEFQEDFIEPNPEKQRIKQKELEENFKKAIESKNKPKQEIKKKPKKKPFLKLGICLIIVSLICLYFVSGVPWIYAKYDPGNEFFYYKDFRIDNTTNDTSFTDFLQSKDSSKYIGVSSNDLTTIPNIQINILYITAALGIAFTIFVILIRRIDFSIKKLRIIHSFFALITSFICIYFIFITVKLLGSNILLYYNQSSIVPNLQNLTVLVLSPIFLIMVMSGVLKIAIAILKINFNEFEKEIDEKVSKKSLSNFKTGGKLK